MNKEKRARLEKAAEILQTAKELIESVKDDEQISFNNLSDSIQASERGSKMEDAIQALEDAMDTIDQTIDSIETASE